MRATPLASILLTSLAISACFGHGPGRQVAFGPGGCLPDRLPAPATTTAEGHEVFVVQALEPGSGGGDCYSFVQIGTIPYIYTKGSERTFRGSEVAGEINAVGGPGTEEIIEVRAVRGVPIEYALAARVEGLGWVALGGWPVESTEMEDESALAETICLSLEDRSMGWSFCQ